MNYPPTIQKLINLFSKFPTVGPRTAARFVFYLLKSEKEDLDELVLSVSNLRKNIKICSLCFNIFEPVTGGEQSRTTVKTPTDRKEKELCRICSNPIRDRSLLCIVEKETDLVAIENTKRYKGLYFVLGGTISALRKKGLKKIRIGSHFSCNLREEELKERITRYSEIKEIIIATNSTSEGITTSLYLERLLNPLMSPTTGSKQGRTIKITRLARGLPTGGELEYADEETLSSALEGRK